jgi:hypothetical protein
MRRTALRTAAAALVLTAATALPARAQNVYAYLYEPDRIHSDNQLFLNLAVRDAGLAPAVLNPLLPRIRSVDSDLPVILFIARQTGRPVDAIVDLRARGLSWAEVFRRLGISYDTLFTGIDRDPGPYYRSTWTYWTAHRAAPRFTDLQVRELARLQLAQRLANVPVIEVARVRNPVVVVADKHGRPWARAMGVPPGHGGVPPGHGGVPPGQVKNGVPPGHREVVRVEEHDRGKVKVKEKEKDKGHDEGEDHGDHGGKDKGDKDKGDKGKGKGKGHGKE